MMDLYLQVILIFAIIKINEKNKKSFREEAFNITLMYSITLEYCLNYH